MEYSHIVVRERKMSSYELSDTRLACLRWVLSPNNTIWICQMRFWIWRHFFLFYSSRRYSSLLSLLTLLYDFMLFFSPNQCDMMEIVLLKINQRKNICSSTLNLFWNVWQTNCNHLYIWDIVMNMNIYIIELRI